MIRRSPEVLLTIFLVFLPPSGCIIHRYRLISSQPNLLDPSPPSQVLESSEVMTAKEDEEDGEDENESPVLDLVDVCGTSQLFELLTSAPDERLRTVHVRPGTWVFATRCKQPGKPCWGIFSGLGSVCRPRKSWLQVEGRWTPYEPWRSHWVAVDTSCVCSLRWKPRTTDMTLRMDRGRQK